MQYLIKIVTFGAKKQYSTWNSRSTMPPSEPTSVMPKAFGMYRIAFYCAKLCLTINIGHSRWNYQKLQTLQFTTVNFTLYNRVPKWCSTFQNCTFALFEYDSILIECLCYQCNVCDVKFTWDVEIWKMSYRSWSFFPSLPWIVTSLRGPSAGTYTVIEND